MTKLFQQERTLEEIMGGVGADELTVLKEQLSEVIKQSKYLLQCMEKIQKQSYTNAKRNDRIKVISLLHKN